MKNVQEFATYVAQNLFSEEPEMAKGRNVEIHTVTKNNGRILTGLTVRKEGCNIAPTVYVNDGYEKYLEGTPIEDLLAGFLRTYKESIPVGNFSVEFFNDYQQVKDRLTMKLINAERNVDFLVGLPHYNFGDLALIFQVQVEASEYGNATITVRKEHRDMWNVSTKELLSDAKANMEEKTPVRIQAMIDVIREMIGDLPDEIIEVTDNYMYVLSNESKVNAASGLIFTDKLQEFADKNDANLFILPSSIHELLLIPDRGEMNVNNLADMVCDVNRTQVAPEDVLSDNVYYYDRNEQMLMFAVTKEQIELVE